MEKILRIEEATFKPEKSSWAEYDGYQIITDNQTIQIGIENSQCCCESFGCIITNDETNEFIGAELIGISLTDTALNNKEIEELEYIECGDTMFVNLETNRGLLQFVAYNCHNGWYGHDAVLISKQLNEHTTL
jgi:hypothetical protein